MKTKREYSKSKPTVKEKAFFAILRKAVTSRPAPLKPVRAKRQTLKG